MHLFSDKGGTKLTVGQNDLWYLLTKKKILHDTWKA
jgi:hypothetical protein